MTVKLATDLALKPQYQHWQRRGVNKTASCMKHVGEAQRVTRVASPREDQATAGAEWWAQCHGSVAAKAPSPLGTAPGKSHSSGTAFLQASNNAMLVVHQTKDSHNYCQNAYRNGCRNA
jgi:hypothetical protein